MARKDPVDTNREDVSTQRGATGTSSNIPLEVQLQAHLGRNLQAAYQALVVESVPSRLRELLDELECQEKKLS
jgi:hypothetical protein